MNKGLLMWGLGCIGGAAPIAGSSVHSADAKGRLVVSKSGAKVLARRQEQGQNERVLKRTLSRVGSFRQLKALDVSQLHGELSQGGNLKEGVEALIAIKSRGDKKLREKAAEILQLNVGGVPLHKWQGGKVAKAMSRQVDVPVLESAIREFDEVGRLALELRRDFGECYGVKSLSDYLSLSELKPEVAKAVGSIACAVSISGGARAAGSTLDARAINELHDSVLKGGEDLEPRLGMTIRNRADVDLLRILVRSLERGTDPEQSSIVSVLDSLASKHPNLSLVLDGLIHYTQELEAEWLTLTHADLGARLDKSARVAFFVEAFKGQMSMLEPGEREKVQGQMGGSLGAEVLLVLSRCRAHSIKVFSAFECLGILVDRGVFRSSVVGPKASSLSPFYEAARVRVESFRASVTPGSFV